MSEGNTGSPPNSRKRSHDGTLLSNSKADDLDTAGESSLLTPSNGATSLGDAPNRSRQASPALSTTSSSLTDLTDLTGEGSKASLSAAPGKKRKLTFAEREVEKALRKQESEAREKQRADDKARREAEKRVKDDEKRKREEEKELARREREHDKAEKQKVKDAEKRTKEDEKRKKEEEKDKKERSQMRIGAFFIKPKILSTPPHSPKDVLSGVSSRRSSIASLEDTEMRDAPSPSPAMKSTNPEYEKLFPPFFVHPNTELAPANRLSCCKADPDVATALSNPSLADMWSNTAPDKLQRIHNTFKFRPRAKRFSRKQKSVRSIIDQIQGSSDAPIDLTGDTTPLHLESLLVGVSLKVFSFHEDVRPGYHGTYTRPVSPRSKLSLCRQPSARKLPDTDYDYDSEAEWEPPAEGDDDLDAIDEESGSEEDEEDMEDFLDDEDDLGKRRLIVGNTDPVCSGLCWQGQTEKRLGIANHFNMKDLEMEIIPDIHSFPIDPYSTKYWVQNKHILPPPARSQLFPSSASLMQPPRLPLQASNQTNIMLSPGLVITEAQHQSTISTENASSASKPSFDQQNPRAQTKSLRLIPNELLPGFKQAVSGSDLNKVGLVEILKKQFPKVSKDVIRDTLSAVAVRQGAKEADKKWVLIDPL